MSGFFILCLSFVGCNGVPKTYISPKAYAIKETSDTVLGKLLSPTVQAHKGNSGFVPLEAGTDAYKARIVSIQMAQKTLDLQYYLWADDRIGKAMGHEVIQAADRGVRVRILLDDLNLGPYEDALLALDRHPQIEVRMFNPFSFRKIRLFEIVRFHQAHRRMHGKLMIADNQTAITGGRNIGEQYFTAHGEENFGDYDVWAFGPIVGQCSDAFDEYWNSGFSVPISVLNQREITDEDYKNLRESFASASNDLQKSSYAKQLASSSLDADFRAGRLKTYWGRAQIYYDSPEKIDQENQDTYDGRNLKKYMEAMPISPPTKELFIVSPYFIPGAKGVEYFKNKEAKGVQVSVFTNSLGSNDVPLTFAGYKKYRKQLIRAGVDLYELKPRVTPKARKFRLVGTSGARLGLHGKVFIFDRRAMFVGSLNLDPRSIELNTEFGVLFESPELADQFLNNALRFLPELSYRVSLNDKNDVQWNTVESGKSIVFSEEPDARWWQSFQSEFLSLFVPETML
ncbi:phospholipase D family protein [Bdellovibrio reynosensis]|uniref:Phospholipase D family protein n=1 Tax=Bdellovibrio reynosensis TaxID=2835041 RepID=A0ABY4C491_9BACT|nr:phospholipase D family protein [Bdellovibrio reynosensis]UOE99780.1 phospholipase D family protein [Bdellovibrio reynosensis]